MLNLVIAWGGRVWKEAAEEEIDWIAKHVTNSSTDKIVLASSGNYYPRLDVVFGPCTHQHQRYFRQVLISMQANAHYWSKSRSDIRPEAVIQRMVEIYY